MKQTFIEFLLECEENDILVEMPVNDYKTFGNWDKAHSFRHAIDRKMVTSEKAIKNVKKKFSKCPYEFNLIFVNSPKASKHTEVGKVNFAFVKNTLDPEVGEAVEKYLGKDYINIIFTNNKGDQRKSMTPWIMMHRCGHVFAREMGMRNNEIYLDVERFLIDQTEQIFKFYDKSEFRPHLRGFYSNMRRDQLAMIYLFNQLATFKSARTKNIRDWFEILNELIAQWGLTGNIKFNSPPRCFNGGAFGKKQNYCCKQEDLSELTEFIQTLSRDMEMMIDQIFSSAVGGIFVM